MDWWLDGCIAEIHVSFRLPDVCHSVQPFRRVIVSCWTLRSVTRSLSGYLEWSIICWREDASTIISQLFSTPNTHCCPLTKEYLCVELSKAYNNVPGVEVSGGPCSKYYLRGLCQLASGPNIFGSQVSFGEVLLLPFARTATISKPWFLSGNPDGLVRILLEVRHCACFPELSLLLSVSLALSVSLYLSLTRSIKNLKSCSVGPYRSRVQLWVVCYWLVCTARSAI